MNSKAHGSVIIPLLFVILLFGIILRSTSQKVISLYHRYQIARHTMLLERDLLYSLLTKPSLSFLTPTITEKRSLGKVESEMALYYSLPKDEKKLYQAPKIDTKEECPSNQISFMNPVHPMVSFKEKSVVALKTCTFEELHVNKNSFATTNNLEVKKLNLFLSKTPYTIISNGYLVVTNTLTLDNDLLIISGGSVFIEKLVATNTNQISIISLSGGIKVNHIEGDINLYVDGLLGVELPEGVLTVNETSLIEESPGWINGYEISASFN